MGTSVGPTKVIAPGENATPQVRIGAVKELPAKEGSSAIARAAAAAKAALAQGQPATDAAKAAAERARSQLSAVHQAAGGNALAAAAAGVTEAPTDDDADGALTEPERLRSDAKGRLHKEDGKFARDPEKPAPEPEMREIVPEGAEAADTGDADADADGEPDADKEALTVVFPAHDQVPELTIEVGSQDVADRLRELQNNGIRKAEYTKRLEALDSREIDIRANEAALAKAPEVFVAERLQPDQQQQIALALVAAHWDDLFPKLVEMADKDAGKAKRGETILGFKQRIFDARTAMDTERANQRQLQQMYKATMSFVPEDTPEDTARRFVHLASQEIGDAMRAGRWTPGSKIAPDDVLPHLRGVLRDFGFSEPAAAGRRNGSTSSAQRSSAKAASEPRATDSASSTRNASGTRDARGEREVARQQRTAASRAIARRVAPAGAGGVPAQPVSVPKGVGVNEMIKYLKTHPGTLQRAAPE